MVRCAVLNCSNYERQRENAGITFHRFPNEEDIKLKWVTACGYKELVDVPYAKPRVCSKHFEDSDYEVDLKCTLLNQTRIKRILKQGTVPHLHLTVHATQERGITAEPSNLFEPPQTDCGTNCLHLLKLESIAKENETLKEKVKNLEKMLSKAQNEIEILKNTTKTVQGRFSPCQVEAILKGRCSNWSSEDVSKAVTLRCISYKALGFVRDSLMVPLPSERTIKRRLGQFSLSPGSIQLSIDILKTQAGLLKSFEKDVILCFDEMKVSNELCFDHKEELVRGPHSNVQVIVIRCLAGKWVQPVYYNFDTAVTKELLFQTIQIVENAGFKVRGFVCDMGPSNRKLMSDLNVTWRDPSIKNPADEARKIWAFCDVPHALKLFRNHLLDDGYILESGECITKEPFVKLIEMQSAGGNDLQHAHKLTMKHVLVAGPERQNVRKAAELLSMTVGKAICYNLPQFSHVGEAVIIVNNGFDVLNSRLPVCSNSKLKSAYGNCLEVQNEALNELYHLILTLRLIEKQDLKTIRTKNDKRGVSDWLLPFQKGFLMSINSLRGLFNDMKLEGYTYILASRCNQDVIESYFSQIRGLGRFYDHPLPTTVTQRIKRLILSRNASEVFNSPNFENDKEIPTLSAEIFSEYLQEETKSTQPSTSTNEYNKTAAQRCSTEVDKRVLERAVDSDTEDFDEAVDGLIKFFHETRQQTAEMIEEDSDLLEMIAGYIAYRIKKKYPEKAGVFGEFTTKLSFSGKNWLHTLSRGFLIKPSKEFFGIVLEMEKEFQSFHGTYINRSPRVFEELISGIKRYCTETDDFAIACFVRTRTFIRIKALNKRAANGNGKRERNLSDDSRKKTKKMKKLLG